MKLLKIIGIIGGWAFVLWCFWLGCQWLSAREVAREKAYTLSIVEWVRISPCEGWYCTSFINDCYFAKTIKEELACRGAAIKKAIEEASTTTIINARVDDIEKWYGLK